LLAFILGEPGGEEVSGEIEGAAISAVNWAEVVQKAISEGIDDRSLRSDIEALGANVLSVDASHAELAARLRPRTQGLGLSLADRICFALAASRGSAVMTADRAWVEIDLGVEVRLIR
jgi:PIN domain nuclease of toxin-antitoxin system